MNGAMRLVDSISEAFAWQDLRDRLLGISIEWFDCGSAADRDVLSARGIKVRQPHGTTGNMIGLGAECTAGAVLNVAIPRGSDNVIVIGANSRMRGKIAVNGSRNLLVNEGATAYNIGALYEIRVNGNDNALLLERKVTSNGCTMNVGHGTSIRIGEDCMFAHETMVYSTDMHALIDLDSRSALPAAQSVRLGRHVWLGRGSMVVKGVTIGDGSLTGAKSLVTRDVPEFCVAAGIPAKVVRERTTWTRKPNPHDEDIDALLDFLGNKGEAPASGDAE